MTDDKCPRNYSMEQMIVGLKKGLVLCVDRRDAPELPELLALEKEGLVEIRLVEIDDQSSRLEVRWKWPIAKPSARAVRRRLPRGKARRSGG